MKDYEVILQSIRALAAGREPDTDISELLYRHNCMYLLSRIKKPHRYSQSLFTNTTLNRINIRERYRCCRSVFEALEDAAIPYAVIKGAALSVSAFGDPYSRHSSDIDLLVSRRDIDRVKQILLQQGFVQGRVTDHGIQPFSRKELLYQSAMSHQTAPFIKNTGNKICPYINVDVNMDIMWGESNRKADMDFVLEHTIQADICGTVIKKLLPEMEFISMCLHHYKDMNSIYLLAQGNLKLKLLCDVYFFVKRNFQTASGNSEAPDTGPAVSTDHLLALCKHLKVTECVYYCLYHTNSVFDDPKLEKLCHVFASPEGEKLLNCYGLAENEIGEWDVSFPKRLFDLNIYEYFQKILPENLLEKIRMNETFM